jgi:hypothetical protein
MLYLDNIIKKKQYFISLDMLAFNWTESLTNYLIASEINDNDQQVLIIVVKSQATPISQESYISISATLKEK